MAFFGFRGTPYAAAEGYYDSVPKRWNRFEANVGIEIPWKYNTILELSFAHQAVWQEESREIIGLTLQKHMAMPIGEGQ